MGAILVEEKELEVGVEAVLTGNSPSTRFSVTFEDDGETGYFYALDRESESPILDALHVYNVAQIVDKEIPSKFEILWSFDGLKAALLINGNLHAAFDFSTRRSFNESGFPPPSPIGDPWERVIENWQEDVNNLFADDPPPVVSDGRSKRKLVTVEDYESTPSDESLYCNSNEDVARRSAALEQLREPGIPPVFQLNDNRLMLLIDSGNGDTEILLEEYGEESSRIGGAVKISQSFLVDERGMLVHGKGVRSEWGLDPTVHTAPEGEATQFLLLKEEDSPAEVLDALLAEIIEWRSKSVE